MYIMAGLKIMNNIANVIRQDFHNFDYKDSVVAATTASFTMASAASTNTLVLANGEGGFNNSANTYTVDGISLTQGQRVLIKDGVNSASSGVHGKWNGIYTVGDLTGTTLTLTRAEDFGASGEIHAGCQVHIERGGTNGDTNYVVTTDGTITVGTTAISFTNIASVSLNSLSDATLDVANDSIAFIDANDSNSSKKEVIKDFVAAMAGDGMTSSAGVLSVNLTEPGLTGPLPVNKGGTGLTSIADNSILTTTGTNTLAALTAPSADRALMYDHSATSIKWVPLGTVCFLKGTKITLPDKSQKYIEDLKLGEFVLTYKIDGLSELKKDDKVKIMNWSNEDMNGEFSKNRVKNIWVNPTEKYLVINDKLRITNLHIIHVKRGDEYKFLPAEKAKIGDFLFTDSGEYERISDIKQIYEKTEVYNIEVRKAKTYFADNYLVHHFCETCSGLSGRI